MNKKKERRRFILVCLTPAVLLFTIFMILPTLNVFWMSTLKWGGLSADQTFVGFDNFMILAKDMNFIQALQNTIFLIAIVTVITMVIAILFASILVREKVKGQNFYRIIFYIPNILSVVVIASIFTAIYDPSSNGLINSVVGIFQPETWETTKFLGDSTIMLYAIAGAMIWQAIGYYMVMYMASMSSIPEHLYEAAQLEGAGKMKQFFSITLPLVWDNIRTTLTFFVISCINLSFLFVKVFGSGPGGASETVLSYMYKQAYDNASYGYGMAIGVVVFIFSFILSAVINRATEREVLEF